jgi:hypothetical protein
MANHGVEGVVVTQVMLRQRRHSVMVSLSIFIRTYRVVVTVIACFLTTRDLTTAARSEEQNLSPLRGLLGVMHMHLRLANNSLPTTVRGERCHAVEKPVDSPCI